MQEDVSRSVANGRAYGVCTCGGPGDEDENGPLCSASADDESSMVVLCSPGYGLQVFFQLFRCYNIFQCSNSCLSRISLVIAQTYTLFRNREMRGESEGRMMTQMPLLVQGGQKQQGSGVVVGGACVPNHGTSGTPGWAVTLWVVFSIIVGVAGGGALMWWHEHRYRYSILLIRLGAYSIKSYSVHLLIHLIPQPRWCWVL